MRRSTLLFIASGLLLSTTASCVVFRSLAGKNTLDLEGADVRSMGVDIRKREKTICPRERVQMAVFADLVLKVRAGAYSVELANPRHEHEWRLWEELKLPKDTILIPGVISHATNILEHPELVAERIVRLARLVGRENVIASTDCGFAQVTYFARVHPQIMWAKLQALVDGARLASKELWRKAAKGPVAKRAAAKRITAKRPAGKRRNE